MLIEIVASVTPKTGVAKIVCPPIRAIKAKTKPKMIRRLFFKNAPLNTLHNAQQGAMRLFL